MTLGLWLIQNRAVYARRLRFGCWLVEPTNPGLYHLSDFDVFSQSCGGLYLVPKQVNEKLAQANSCSTDEESK